MSAMVIYGAVIFEGPFENVEQAKEDLKGRKIKILGTSGTTIGFAEISSKVLPELKQHLAKKYGLSLLHCYQPKTVGMKPRVAAVKKEAQLSLEANKWYFLESAEDYYPFLFVRSISEADGNKIFEVELLDGENAMPNRIRVFADDLAKLGLRPATTDDFVEYDIPPPENSLLTSTAATTPSSSPDLSTLSNFVN